jgi:uncharacterized membrane protein
MGFCYTFHMTYNIHPLFVHFPIALLLVYSFIKILPFDRWFPKVAWKDIERALLFFGVLGAFAALLTGDTAEHLFVPDRKTVDMHSAFATISTYMYGALLLGELLAYFNPKLLPKITLVWLRNVMTFLASLLTNRVFSRVLALLALVAITVTGLLGGVMVYGTTADPLAGVVLKVLGISQ